VIRTRVGYDGGEKINPTYYDLGDHSETIQIDFDPEKITYPQLLQIFWDNHNCKLKSVSRQYMSIVFYHNVKQRDAATQSMQEQEKKLETKLVTEILPLTQFYRAEDYHQKYSLQLTEDISDELKKIYPNFQDFVDSTAVARINGFIGGRGTCEQLKKEISTYGLTEVSEKYLLNLVCQY
jgi:peptide-methionine (S)-S-oxide reductase